MLYRAVAALTIAVILFGVLWHISLDLEARKPVSQEPAPGTIMIYDLFQCRKASKDSP